MWSDVTPGCVGPVAKRHSFRLCRVSIEPESLSKESFLTPFRPEPNECNYSDSNGNTFTVCMILSQVFSVD